MTDNPDLPTQHEGLPSRPPSFWNPTAQRRPIDHFLQAIRTHTHHEASLDRSPSHTPKDHHQNIFGDVRYLWRSRDNRKGRHTILVSPPTAAAPLYLTPPPTNTPHSILHNLYQMLIYYPLWDISYLTAQSFTWGSIIWVLNAFFSWLPSVLPSSSFPTESAAAGITAFIGATVFEIGSVFLMIEAVNENRTDCFGWALEEVLEENGLVRVTPDREACTHHHFNRRNLVGRGPSPSSAAKQDPNPRRRLRDARVLDSWIWFPTPHDLRVHFLHDIGFLACLSQFLGATIFWISGFTALPPIQTSLSPAALDGAYWAPQVVGGVGFIISSLLFCLETQTRWWMPAPRVLGWWVGAWNLVGAVGFTMSGACGYWAGSKGTYQAGLSTFWASWAFLIGSAVQWYESLVKHPVEVEREKRGKGDVEGRRGFG